MSKIWFQKLLKFITALREHCENAKEREAMLIKLPKGTDLRSQFSFSRQRR